MTNEEAKHHIEAILNQELLMSLATCGNNQPWASVVGFVADSDLNLYWRSASQARHSQNITANPVASATITLPLNEKNQGIGLQIGGRVEIISEDQAAQLPKDKKDLSSSSSRPCCKLTPTEIYLIHEPLLGYSRFTYKKEA
jgi:uncharacterized protein YhbP (UPF0306 family)